jgi:hypothetical protein
MNGNGIPTNTVTAQTGLITKFFHWFEHPQFADSDPVDWFAFAVLLIMAGVLWSKVVKQTLDAAL